jgi:serine/threonine protein kinase
LKTLRRICGGKALLPRSVQIPMDLDVRPEPFAQGGFGDMYNGTLHGSRVCVKRLRVHRENALESVMKVRSMPSLSLSVISRISQAFCQEVVMWKSLNHPNIVPLLGATISPSLQLISSWMSGGQLPTYIKEHPDARLIWLVRIFHYVCSVLTPLQAVRRCQGPRLSPFMRRDSRGPQGSEWSW